MVADEIKNVVLIFFTNENHTFNLKKIKMPTKVKKVTSLRTSILFYMFDRM